MGDAVGIGGETLILGQVIAADMAAKALPQIIRADSENEPVAAASLHRFVWDDLGMAVAAARRILAGGKILAGVIAQPGQLAFLQGTVDQLALAAAMAGMQGGEDADQGEEAAGHIGYRRGEAHGRAIDLAGERHRSRFGLRYQVISRLPGPRPGASIATDGGINQARVAAQLSCRL